MMDKQAKEVSEALGYGLVTEKPLLETKTRKTTSPKKWCVKTCGQSLDHLNASRDKHLGLLPLWFACTSAQHKS